MLGVIAKLTIKPGANADFEATMKALQAKVRADEPGNKLYALHKTAESNVYVMLERYDDQAALERAAQTPEMKALHADGAKFIGRIKSWVVEEKTIVG